MRVIGGFFGQVPATLQTSLTGSFELLLLHTNKGDYKYRTDGISTVDVVTDKNKITVLGAAAGAGVGAILAGPIGAIVGGVLTGKTTEKLVSIGLNDPAGFRQIIAVVNQRELETIASAAAAPKKKSGKSLDWSFLESSTNVECPCCKCEMLQDESLSGQIVSCPVCQQLLQMP